MKEQARLFRAGRISEEVYYFVVREADRKRELSIIHERAAIFLAWHPFWAVWGKPQSDAHKTFPNVR